MVVQSQFAGRSAAEKKYAAAMAIRAGIFDLRGFQSNYAGKWLEDNGYARLSPILDAATESSATAGGYLVQDELSNRIVQFKARAGVSRQLCQIEPMGSDQRNVPKESNLLTVRYAKETETLTDSDANFSNVSLGAAKRNVLTFISNELNDDALISFGENFSRRSGQAFASQEDNELVNADGTSTYDGEVGLLASLGAGGIYTAATGHDSWPELTVADFAGAMGLVHENFANGGESWLVHPSFYAIAMLGAVSGASQGFTPDGKPLFLGKPVYFTRHMPGTSAADQVSALYGSFADAVMIGDRSIGFSFSDRFADSFLQDRVAMKAQTRYDINCHEMGDATNPGAVIGLKTAAS
jgi:HK97 family phage major capsid protein